MDYAHPELIAEPDWLAEHLHDADVRVVDCAILEAYRRAHITGAVHLSAHYYVKEDDPDGTDHGVLVMPPRQFEALMSKLGVGPETTVVAYDDNNGFLAARLWWVLNYYGHTKARVLNGGWHRWFSEGRPTTFHATRVAPAAFKAAEPRSDIYASCEMLLEKHDQPGWQVFDARTDAEWEGTNDRGNRRAGHVPNARHLEWAKFVSTDDRRSLLPADDIQGLLAEAGFTRDRQTITYCQGGIRAAHAAFVLALMGYDRVRVYDGSMREWANRDDTPLVK
jgi:thiosulfate/3-mercaptopyruvate sulfurtransferase